MHINTDQFNHFKIDLEVILETYKYRKLVKIFAILVYEYISDGLNNIKH